MGDVGKTSAGTGSQAKAPKAPPPPTTPLPSPVETRSATTSHEIGNGLKFVAGVGGVPQDLRIPAYDRTSGQYSGYFGVEYSAEQEHDLGHGFTAQTTQGSTLMHTIKPGEASPLLEAKAALGGSVTKEVGGVTLTAGVGVDLGADVSMRGVTGFAAPSVSAGAAFNLGKVHVDSRLDAPVTGFKNNWAMNTTVGVPDSKYLPDLEVANGPDGLTRVGLSKSLQIRDGISLEANVGVDSPLSKGRNVSAGVTFRWKFGK